MANDVTEILRAIEDGDHNASSKLLPLVYDELRRLARVRLAGEAAHHSLDATALVHEAYLRLVANDDGDQQVNWNGRGHFFGAAAEAMRRILIDRARARSAQKRGGEFNRVEFDEIEHRALKQPVKLLALDGALEKLEKTDPQKSQLVKLRFFAGLTNKQAATAIGISESTADRYWTYARAWLKVEMNRD